MSAKVARSAGAILLYRKADGKNLVNERNHFFGFGETQTQT